MIKLFEVIDSPKNLFLVMEHAPSGSLLDYVRARKRLSEADACVFFQQVSTTRKLHGVAVLAFAGRALLTGKDVRGVFPWRLRSLMLGNELTPRATLAPDRCLPGVLPRAGGGAPRHQAGEGRGPLAHTGRGARLCRGPLVYYPLDYMR